MMQMMQDQANRRCEYPQPSYEHQNRKFNNHEGRKNFEPWQSTDHPKHTNVVREECSAPQREECSCLLGPEEEEVSLADDCVHMLTEEDINAEFATCEIQPFNVSEEDLQHIIDHSIKVAQRDLEKELASTFVVNEQPPQECVQQYHRRNIPDGKSKTPWGKLTLPLNAKSIAM